MQFGLDYGVSNVHGKPSVAEVAAILKQASGAGIEVLDTASSYGNSESVLGATRESTDFRIITKTPVARNYESEKPFGEHIKETLDRSLENLKVDRVAGLLVHHADDLDRDDPRHIWEAMTELKESGLVEKIGVSVYDAKQIDMVLDQFLPDIIQLPVNVFDQRLIVSGHLRQLAEKGVEIHARSLFLQGLLLMKTEEIPGYFNPILTHLRKYDTCIRKCGLSKLGAALGFVKLMEYPGVALVGVNSGKELGEVLEAWNDIGDCAIDYEQFRIDDENYLNPAKWKIN